MDQVREDSGAGDEVTTHQCKAGRATRHLLFPLAVLRGALDTVSFILHYMEENSMQ